MRGGYRPTSGFAARGGCNARKGRRTLTAEGVGVDGTVAFGTEGVFGRAGSFRYGALWTKSKMEIRGKFSLHGAILVAISNGTCRRSAGRTIDNFRCSLCNHAFVATKTRMVILHQKLQRLTIRTIRPPQNWPLGLIENQPTNPRVLI